MALTVRAKPDTTPRRGWGIALHGAELGRSDITTGAPVSVSVSNSAAGFPAKRQNPRPVHDVVGLEQVDDAVEVTSWAPASAAHHRSGPRRWRSPTVPRRRRCVWPRPRTGSRPGCRHRRRSSRSRPGRPDGTASRRAPPRSSERRRGLRQVSNAAPPAHHGVRRFRWRRVLLWSSGSRRVRLGGFVGVDPESSVVPVSL